MTILILDNSPEKIAQSLDDKSLEKMIKTIAQTLCNVHCSLIADGKHNIEFDEIQKNFRLKDYYIKSPSYLYDKWTQWGRECVANYKRLVKWGFSCCGEYTQRFSEIDFEEFKGGIFEKRTNVIRHKYNSVIEWARDNVPELPEIESDVTCTAGQFSSDMTPFPFMMPKQYIVEGYFNPEKYAINEENIILKCYRNYYNHLLTKSLKKCNSIFESSNEIIGGCPENNNYVEIKWTRREKPEWVNL